MIFDWKNKMKNSNDDDAVPKAIVLHLLQNSKNISKLYLTTNFKDFALKPKGLVLFLD